MKEPKREDYWHAHCYESDMLEYSIEQLRQSLRDAINPLIKWTGVQFQSDYAEDEDIGVRWNTGGEKE